MAQRQSRLCPPPGLAESIESRQPLAMLVTRVLGVPDCLTKRSLTSQPIR